MLNAIILFSLALAALIVYAYFIETRRFRIVHATVKTRRGLGATLRILHLSDSHFAEGDEAKLRFLRRLHEAPVDMVVVTGDIIENNTGIEYCIEALRGFNAPLGVFAVFGAHDHWDTRFWNVVRDLSLGGYRKGKPNDFARLVRELESIGVVCLHNESTRILIPARGGASEAELWMVGIDDLFAGLDDFEKALEGVPDEAFKILLTHAVESPEALAARGFDVVFAGHSHGGQVRLPLYGPVITRSSLQRKYASGVFEVGGAIFHLNNGIGTGKWTEFRFLCPPEATCVELS